MAQEEHLAFKDLCAKGAAGAGVGAGVRAGVRADVRADELAARALQNICLLSFQHPVRVDCAAI